MDTAQDQKLRSWVRETRHGNAQSYEFLLSEIVGVLRTYFMRRVERKEWVEDLVQESLISVHRYLPTYDAARLLGPWLYAIAEHRLIDAMRKLRRIEKNETSAESLDWKAVINDSDRDETGLDLDEVLSLLSPKQRQVIALLKVKNMSVKEVAAATGFTISDVKVTAFRGYETLRRYYGVGRENR